MLAALKQPASAELRALCRAPAFVTRLFAAFVKAVPSPVGRFVQLFEGEASRAPFRAALDECEGLSRLLGPFPTPSALVRRTFPNTAEDLAGAGMPSRPGPDGKPLALLSRACSPQNVLMALPQGLNEKGELSPRRGDSWRAAMGLHSAGDTTSPFTSWSADPGVDAMFANPGSNLLFAEVPADELIINTCGLPSRKGGPPHREQPRQRAHGAARGDEAGLRAGLSSAVAAFGAGAVDGEGREVARGAACA